MILPENFSQVVPFDKLIWFASNIPCEICHQIHLEMKYDACIIE